MLGTGRTYTLSLADNGARNSLACDVVATNAGGHSALKTSANTVALGIAPTVAIIARPTDITEATVASFELAIGGGGADTVECSIDGGAFLPCTAAPAPSYQLAVPGVNGADHTFNVRVTNPVAAASDTDALEDRAADADRSSAICGPPRSDHEHRAAITWTLGGGAATVKCKLTRTAPVPCATPDQHVLSGLTTAADWRCPQARRSSLRMSTPRRLPRQRRRPRTRGPCNPQLPVVAITTAPTSGTTSTSANFAWTLEWRAHRICCVQD